MQQIPQVPGLPFLGNILQFRNDPIKFIHEVAPQHGRLVKLKMGPQYLYVASHPDDIQHILRDHNRNYVKANTVYPLFVVSGEALVNMEGESWLDRRRVMQPYFHRKRVTSLTNLMQSAVEDQFAILDPLAEQGQSINLTQTLRLMTAHVFTKTFYGITLSKDEVQAMSEAMYNVLTYVWPRYTNYAFIPEALPFPGKTKFEQSRRVLHDVSRDLIARRRKMAHGDDLLSMMIEMSEGDEATLTDEQLHKETVSLFQGGFDTSSGTLAWLFYALSQHPDVEGKLVEEYDTVLKGQRPSGETVNALTYTHQVIQETMRLYPSAPGVLRVSVEDDELGGYRLPAGSMVLVSFIHVHRDPAFWDTPERFLPERFVGGDHAATKHPFAYVPFASGPRQCIGDQFALYEMRLTVASLLQRYKFHLHPEYTLQVSEDATYFPRDLMMRLERR